MRLRGRLASVAALLVLASCRETSWDRNVVLVVVDTLRAEGLPLYGGAESTAPFLAHLGREGLVFEQAWSASSWTAPATASIFTSTYPNEHGVVVGLKAYRNNQEVSLEIPLNRIPHHMETIPVFMRSQGYRTYGVSGNLNIDENMGFTRGFDRFETMDYHDDYNARRLVSRLLEWRDEMLGAQPFFLYVHFMDPHGPYHRHPEWVPADAPAPPSKPLGDRIAYNSEIRLVDEQIRRLFQELGLDDALLIVTSDHGQEFGEHGGFGHRFQLYSELTRIPLLLRHPDGPTGRVSRGVSNLDVLPTLRALLRAPASEQDRGMSLLGADPPAGAERSLFSMRSSKREGQGTKRAIIKSGRKLIVSEPEGRVEFYDLDADPLERVDLARSRAAEVRELRALLEEQEGWGTPSKHEAAESVSATPELVEMLEHLGYVEEEAPEPE